MPSRKQPSKESEPNLAPVRMPESPFKEGPVTAADVRDREAFAHDQTCRDAKDHYERRGVYKTGEQIERESKQIIEQIAKEGDHYIYKGRQ